MSESDAVDPAEPGHRVLVARHAIDAPRTASAVVSVLSSWWGAVPVSLVMLPLAIFGAVAIYDRPGREEHLGVAIVATSVVGVSIAVLLYGANRRSTERLMRARFARMAEEIGPIEVRLTDEGMTERGATGTLTWPWTAYSAFVVVDGLALLVRHGIVEGFPLDAFDDPRAAEALLASAVPRATPSGFRRAARSAV